MKLESDKATDVLKLMRRKKAEVNWIEAEGKRRKVWKKDTWAIYHSSLEGDERSKNGHDYDWDF